MRRSGASQCRPSVLCIILMLICTQGRDTCAQGVPFPSVPPSARAESVPESAPLPSVFSDESEPRNAQPRGAEPLEKPVPSLRPEILRRPIDALVPPTIAEQFPRPETNFRLPDFPPLGYTGSSGVLPTESQQSSHFVPIEDRWRLGFPEWDRYGKGHPLTDDYPYMPGRWF